MLRELKYSPNELNLKYKPVSFFFQKTENVLSRRNENPGKLTLNIHAQTASQSFDTGSNRYKVRIRASLVYLAIKTNIRLDSMKNGLHFNIILFSFSLLR